MNKPQSNSPRTRLQVLRAIPERDRTEAEWDEMNELEIMLAAENRQIIPAQGQGQGQGHGQGQGQGHGQNMRQKSGGPSPKGPAHGKQPDRKFHKRARRRKPS
jgi:hypothetical protein